MSNEIYTATGCARCKIAKRFMQENDIAYTEYDFKAEGNEKFAQFYRANRRNIFRDENGVEFPVFYDGESIRQGVSVILGYLIAGTKLDDVIGRSNLHGDWIDGFDISAGNPEETDNLIRVLSYLKDNGLKIQCTSNGKNASVLHEITKRNLCDRLMMEVKGPVELYHHLVDGRIEETGLKASLKLAQEVPAYSYFTTIVAVTREDGTVSYLTPEEIAQTAQFIKEATGSSKHIYELKALDPQASQRAGMEPLEPKTMFKYRTAARRFLVRTEIIKS